MSAHFKWYPASEETIVPWNARYAFPSQANKSVKMTPRIPPKNGAVFNPGQVLRLEFPAQGYVNPLNTTLEFDVTLMYPTPAATSAGAYAARFQNNIQSIFSRVRLLYGATPLEDIIDYNQIVRLLTEWTTSTQEGVMDQSSVNEGIGGYIWGNSSDSSGGVQGVVNTRQKFIQGGSVGSGTATVVTAAGSMGNVPQTGTPPAGITAPSGFTAVTRRYQINFALGLFTQDKLIPAKFMASQLAIEVTLEQAAACIYVPYAGTTNVVSNVLTGLPTYAVANVNLIPEILEFDASYDAMFLKGLQEGGVPIKFSTWHTFISSSANSSNVNFLVQERSRSVKSIFAIQKRAQASFLTDSHATFLDTSTAGTSSLQSYQYRIGGRYFPAQPVQVSTSIGSAVSNGGCEAYVELAKALNIVGDYRLTTPINSRRWALQNASGTLQEFDFTTSLNTISGAGVTAYSNIESTTNAFSGTLGSQCFAMAINLESTNGTEISGLNAEEQSDIALIANWTSAQMTGTTFNRPDTATVSGSTPSQIEVFTFFDAMIVLRENNVLELIQ